MGPLPVKPAACLKGKVILLGDKSIAHRAMILSSIALGTTRIENFPANDDCLATVEAFKKLGVKTNFKLDKKNRSTGVLTVKGVGLYGLKKPESPIFVGESGTTLRIVLGIAAGQKFNIIFKAGKSLSRRPMLRVTAPLRLMGADIKAKRVCRGIEAEDYPPITVRGGDLKAIDYNPPVASAQVKSAVLLAGLYAPAATRVIERLKTRDHTERMLKLFQAEIKITDNTVVVKGGNELTSPGEIYIPGDISSASFFIVLAAICRNSEILIKNVGLNPSRVGILRVLKRMGACIQVIRGGMPASAAEPMGDLLVKSSSLKGTIVKREEVPFLIDELPILMVAGCFAAGKTIFEGVQELRVKETDRIKSMVENLREMGASISVTGGGKQVLSDEKIIIEGGKLLKGIKVKSYADHRTAMSMIVAALNSEGVSEIDEVDCINKSFPNFLCILKNLRRSS